MTTLRDGTRDLHEQVDSAVREGDWLTSSSAYVEYLKRSLRFHRIVESVVQPHLAGLSCGDWQWQARSPLLEADLRDLTAFPDIGSVTEGHASAAQDTLRGLAADGRPGAVGVLYVVEGSALGARVLARWVRSRLGYDGTFAASSLVPYGAETAERWRAFGALAERVAQLRPDYAAAMVVAARAAFGLHAELIGSPANTGLNNRTGSQLAGA